MRKPKNSIFSELYFDQYEVSVTAKNIRYFEVEEHPLVKVICTAANVFTNTCAQKIGSILFPCLYLSNSRRR